MNVDPYRAFMTELATRSGELIRGFYGNPGLAVEVKSDATPVTQADRGAEELMRGMIEKTYPRHGIVGEEFGSKDPDAEFVWVLDPIDGTKSFIAGVPLWGTLIGLLHRGEPVLGCIHQPVLEEMLIGDNTRTELNGRRARCRRTAGLEEATFLTSDMPNLERKLGPAGAAGVLGRVRVARTWGDCYGYLMVATGRADVMCDPVMNLWDIAALVPVIRGAGGTITNWMGGPPYPADSIVAAGTAELHAEALKALGARNS